MYMGELKLYQDIKNAPDDDSRFQIIAHAIEEAKKPDISHLVTADYLDKRLAEQEVRILKAINEQTWKFVGSIALLGVIFKIAEMVWK